jgi:hypothetical protein
MDVTTSEDSADGAMGIRPKVQPCPISCNAADHQETRPHLNAGSSGMYISSTPAAKAMP